MIHWASSPIRTRRAVRSRVGHRVCGVEISATTKRIVAASLVALAPALAHAQAAPDSARPVTAPVDRSAVEWISRFEFPLPDALFGAGWGLSTDQASGGQSTASVRVVDDGVHGTGHALRVEGTVDAGLPYAWAGTSFYPGAVRYGEADLAAKDSLVFWTKGDGGTYRVMLITQAPDGREARTERRFTASPDWARIAIGLRDLRGANLRAVKAITFVAGPKAGPFAFQLDDVRLR